MDKFSGQRLHWSVFELIEHDKLAGFAGIIAEDREGVISLVYQRKTFLIHNAVYFSVLIHGVVCCGCCGCCRSTLCRAASIITSHPVNIDATITAVKTAATAFSFHDFFPSCVVPAAFSRRKRFCLSVVRTLYLHTAVSRAADKSLKNFFFVNQPFMDPIITPFTKCFCTSGYITRTGILLMMISEYFHNVDQLLFFLQCCSCCRSCCCLGQRGLVRDQDVTQNQLQRILLLCPKYKRVLRSMSSSDRHHSTEPELR